MPDNTYPQRKISFSGFDAPNYTQVPDQLFDELMVQLSGAELKVLLYIIRRTFGFKKECDNISLSQMLNGINTRDGRVQDRGVGLTKKTLLQALNSLEENSIIETERRISPEKGNEPTTYRLKMTTRASEQALGVKTTPPLGEKLHQGVGEVIPPSPRSKNYPTQETVRQETGLQPSNIRRAKPIEKNEDERTNPSARIDASIPKRPFRLHPHQQGEQERETSGLETVGSVLARQRPRSAAQPDEARQVILAYIEDFAREFNDQAPLKSSTTRAYHLYQQSGLAVGAFIAQMQEARALTKESTAQIRSQTNGEGRGAPTKKKMAYFFACLEDRLGLRDDEDNTIHAAQ